VINRREELLRAIKEAAKILDRFPVVSPRSSYDIVGTVTALDIPLMFRPLKKLWGATVSDEDSDVQGVLITTALDLAIQRFTLAHELGHVLLGHKTSFDETIGFTGRYGPRSLLFAVAKQHRWDREALALPKNAYQMALRLGISYQATCWALHAGEAITRNSAQSLQSEALKKVKLSMAPEKHLENPWANVWRLTASDSGSFLEAGPDDLFSVSLSESASSGYLWRLVDAGSNAEVLEDDVAVGERYGQDSDRSILLRLKAPGMHRLVFEHQRPWSGQKLAHIDISVDNLGREQDGQARRLKQLALAGQN
jgi:hypothetical protein